MSLELALSGGTEEALRESFEETVEELCRGGMQEAEQTQAEIQVCCPAVRGDVGAARAGVARGQTPVTRRLPGLWLESLISFTPSAGRCE